VPPEAWTQLDLVPPYCTRVPVPLAKVVRLGILKWSICGRLNSLLTPVDVPVPRMIVFEAPLEQLELVPIIMQLVASLLIEPAP